jgi:hypothetical protein
MDIPVTLVGWSSYEDEMENGCEQRFSADFFCFTIGSDHYVRIELFGVQELAFEYLSSG